MEPRKKFNMGESIVPPPVSNNKSAAPPRPPPRHIGTSLQENGDKSAVSPPPRQRQRSFRKMVGWGKNASCVHVMLCALLSLAAVGKVSKPKRGHPMVESL